MPEKIIELKRFYHVYGVKPAEAGEIFSVIEESVENQAPLSLIRAGEIVTRVLTGNWGLINPDVFDFLGIPNPLPDELIRQLHLAVAEADILGPTTSLKGRTGFARQLKAYLDRYKIKPMTMTWPYIGDDLYETGYIHRLINNYRVIFIGRSAPLAADRHNGSAVMLDNWLDTDNAEIKTGKDWDLALIGAGIPGRVLCSRLRNMGKVALEIGHIMDALAYPHIWEQTDISFRRRAFQNAIFENREPSPVCKGATTRHNKDNIYFKYTGTVKSGAKSASAVMKKDDTRKQLKKITKKEIIPGTLNVRLDSSLIIKAGRKWRYGNICPAILNGLPVFVNKKPNFGPDYVTVLSDIRLRESLNLRDNDKVVLEIQSCYIKK